MIGFWTDEKVTALRKFAADGLTTRQIGEELDTTKNSVIGKARRLKILLNHSSGFQSINEAKRSAPRKRKIVVQIISQDLAPPLVEDAPTEPKPLLDLRSGDCRWPLGGDYEPAKLFCAAPAIDGHPYCGAHCRIAYHNFAHRRAA